MSKRVRAGGGVVWRRAANVADGSLEVLLVHRPRYDDWTLPKGKMEPGEESEAETAVREVWEETGLECELGDELPSIQYVDRFGRDKTVRYWLMAPTGGELTINDEVDEFRWLPPSEALEALSYPRDREVLLADHPLLTP
jgi:8-oxo-dGTP pyrophosphatase MutT (NUDIX family)